MNDFKGVPLEKDTQILKQKETLIDGTPVLFQAWRWEAISAESVIFHAADVQDLSDEELFQKVQDNFPVHPGSQHTIARPSSGYIFVNFNFKY